jgi:hypothetical protein
MKICWASRVSLESIYKTPDNNSSQLHCLFLFLNKRKSPPFICSLENFSEGLPTNTNTILLPTKERILLQISRHPRLAILNFLFMSEGIYEICEWLSVVGISAPPGTQRRSLKKSLSRPRCHVVFIHEITFPTTRSLQKSCRKRRQKYFKEFGYRARWFHFSNSSPFVILRRMLLFT